MKLIRSNRSLKHWLSVGCEWNIRYPTIGFVFEWHRPKKVKGRCVRALRVEAYFGPLWLYGEIKYRDFK